LQGSGKTLAFGIPVIDKIFDAILCDKVYQ
jgi:superfamily II DNA/RNA helicase